MKATNQGRAISAVQAAVAGGILPSLRDGRTKCTDCQKPATVYDHRDYLKPLVVDPVCWSCNSRRGRAANHPDTVTRVEIRGLLRARIRRLAAIERRSFGNMAEVLVTEAIAIRARAAA